LDKWTQRFLKDGDMEIWDAGNVFSDGIWKTWNVNKKRKSSTQNNALEKKFNLYPLEVPVEWDSGNITVFLGVPASHWISKFFLKTWNIIIFLHFNQ
jgi:hypothetical protein